MNNWSCNSMNDYLWQHRHDLTTRPLVMVVFGCLYFCIIVLGTLGNSCVVLSVARTTALRTVPNMFIVSLSCSDVVVCLTSATITPITAFTKNWIFGSALCTIAPLISGISLCFSTFTLTAVAIDRFILIAFPTKSSIEPRHAITTIVMIIVLSACLSTPMMLKQSLKSYAGFCGKFCTEEWGDDDTGRRIYGTIMLIGLISRVGSVIKDMCECISFIAHKPLKHAHFCGTVGSREVGLQFVLPLLIITFCYTTISVRLGQSLILKNQNKHAPMSAQRQSASKRRQRTNRMLIAMVVAFAASWISNITFNVLRDYDRLPRWAKSQEYLFGLATHCIAMTSTVWNPLLYAWLNLQLRAAFLELVPKRFWSNRQQQCARQPGGDESPANANGRPTTVLRGETTRDCNTSWRRAIALQSGESRQQLSDSIRAPKANYGTLDDVNADVVYDDEAIELIPAESPTENSNRRASTRGSFRYFVSKLSNGGDYHRFMNSVVPHSQPSTQILPTTNKERRRKLTAIELFNKNDLLTTEKTTVCRTSSL